MNRIKVEAKLIWYRKINSLTGCWVWTGNKDKIGRGSMRIDGKTYRPHRIAAEIFLPNYVSWLQVNHKCDNPSCFNPDHLYMGTQQDNITDCVKRGRFKYHKPDTGENSNFAKLTEKQVLEIRSRYPDETLEQLADAFGICKSNVSQIVRKITWKEI